MIAKSCVSLLPVYTYTKGKTMITYDGSLQSSPAQFFPACLQAHWLYNMLLLLRVNWIHSLSVMFDIISHFSNLLNLIGSCVSVGKMKKKCKFSSCWAIWWYDMMWWSKILKIFFLNNYLTILKIEILALRLNLEKLKERTGCT